MRQAGTIDSKSDAQQLADYLLSLGITSKLEPAGEQWAIWVHDENQLQRSRDELAQFKVDPSDARYKAAAQAARQVRRETTQKTRQAQRNYVDMRNEWAKPWHRRPVTLTLMVISVLVYLFGDSNAWLTEQLLISTKMTTLPELENGEVWRLFTPIFLHGGFIHILFNMFMLNDLGTLVERAVGSWRFLLLVLVMAAVSNVVQFKAHGPLFGGMSGVVYGLFGYAWVRGRLDPSSGLYLRQDIVFWMLGWFLLCAWGFIDHVANWAHGGGLASGAALGYLAYTLDRIRRRRR
jgi:GlpG protein